MSVVETCQDDDAKIVRQIVTSGGVIRREILYLVGDDKPIPKPKVFRAGRCQITHYDADGNVEHVEPNTFDDDPDLNG
jgi:hypothetical protein